MNASDIRETPEYEAIATHYEGKKAARSGVPYLSHINEGLVLLDALEASTIAKRAWCLHPIVQSGESLIKFNFVGFNANVLIAAMEYRGKANAYLSVHQGMPGRQPLLSPLEDVNMMLRADKVQNRKDFELHRNGARPDSQRLQDYFWEWCEVLGISARRYQELAEMIS